MAAHHKLVVGVHLHLLAGLRPQACVGPIADRVLVRVGDADDPADFTHTHLVVEVGGEV